MTAQPQHIPREIILGPEIARPQLEVIEGAGESSEPVGQLEAVADTPETQDQTADLPREVGSKALLKAVEPSQETTITAAIKESKKSGGGGGSWWPCSCCNRFARLGRCNKFEKD